MLEEEDFGLVLLLLVDPDFVDVFFAVALREEVLLRLAGLSSSSSRVLRFAVALLELREVLRDEADEPRVDLLLTT